MKAMLKCDETGGLVNFEALITACVGNAVDDFRHKNFIECSRLLFSCLWNLRHPNFFLCSISFAWFNVLLQKKSYCKPERTSFYTKG
jgi:hypothetical protein